MSETRWHAYRNENHEPVNHQVPDRQRRAPDGRVPFTVSEEGGPKAVMLERALAIAGLLDKARDIVDPRTADLPRIRVERVSVSTADGGHAPEAWVEDRPWPEDALRVRVHVVWTSEEGETKETLESDLALTTGGIDHPSDAHPVIARTHGMTRERLYMLLLTAYSGADGSQPSGEELDEHRETAEAIAEIVINGSDGKLAAIERLIARRVLPCLPQAAKRDGVQVHLFTRNEAAAVAEHAPGSRSAPKDDSDPAEKRATRRRLNRLAYEHTAFAGYRWIEVGTRIAGDGRLSNRLLERTDGRELWDMDSRVKGRLVELTAEERRDAAGWRPGATHAVTWTIPRPSGRHEAVHLLEPAEVDDLRKRVTGWLIDEAIAIEARMPTEGLGANHPLRSLAAEHKARKGRC